MPALQSDARKRAIRVTVWTLAGLALVKGRTELRHATAAMQQQRCSVSLVATLIGQYARSLCKIYTDSGMV